MYLTGLRVERDPAQSFQCFKAAAKQGFAESEIHLAELYKKGLGVEQSSDDRWYCAAAATGNVAAQLQIQSLNASCPAIAAQNSTPNSD